MNGVAGQASFTLTALVTGPVEPSRWNTASTAPTPPGVQYGRPPSTFSSFPMSKLRVQTWVSRLGFPVSPATDGSGRVSTAFSGPRLDAAVAVGSQPSPALDGRDWKYCSSGLPSE